MSVESARPNQVSPAIESVPEWIDRQIIDAAIQRGESISQVAPAAAKVAVPVTVYQGQNEYFHA